MFRFDLISKCLVWVSDNVQDILGYDPRIIRQWTRRDMKEAIHPADENVFKHYLTFLLGIESAPFRSLIRIRDHQGKYLCFAGSSATLKQACIGRRNEVTGVLLHIGDLHFTPPLPSSAIFKGKPEKPAVIQSLTRRELQVLSYFARGYHCREISEILNLSFHTVDTYRKTLLRKLKMRNIAAMTAFAGECGLNH
jgi:DNA-binding CsgD family transcriptional regulator